MQQHKEKPILFNSEMVKAVLSGRKTQARRVIRNQPTHPLELCPYSGWAEVSSCCYCNGEKYKCPYGQVGDRLWVRETFSYPEINSFIEHNISPHIQQDVAELEYGFHYWADGDPEYGDWSKPKPSIHMPRRVSRINLEITDIRVERVQDITEEDAIREGAMVLSDPSSTSVWGRGFARACFRKLWESINEKRGYGWGVNPWVWVVEFKVIT